MQGHAPKQLLRSYEAERRPVAQANTALSVANWREAMKVGALLQEASLQCVLVIL